MVEGRVGAFAFEGVGASKGCYEVSVGIRVSVQSSIRLGVWREVRGISNLIITVP